MNNSDSKIPVIQKEQITARARELWQKAGSPKGRDLEFWVGAEAELTRDREDVRQTQRGESETARSTPGGNDEGKSATLPKDASAVKPAKKTSRVAASVK